MDVENNLYSIQFVSSVTGINPHTIRAWEKRYGVTTPMRDKNGRRLYTDTEIQRLELLYRLVNFGNSISDISALKNEDLSKILKKYSIEDESLPVKCKHIDIDLKQIMQNIHMSIGAFKLEVMIHELGKAEAGLSPIDFAMKVINPMISEIRHQKGSGAINSEQKTQMYLVIKSHLYKKIFATDNKGRNSKKIIYF